MIDFKEVKQIKITNVVGRYDVGLRFKGEYAKCPCPLPTHKKGDRNANFTIHIPSNTWRCFSDSCIAESKLDGKPQDVITFVRIMEGMRRPIEAAQKLAEWYGLNGNTPRRERVNSPNKTAPHIEARAVQEVKSTPLPNIPENTSSSEGVKYMQAIDAWFDLLVKRGDSETDEVYWKRVRNGVKAQLIQSYKAGQKKAQGLAVA